MYKVLVADHDPAVQEQLKKMLVAKQCEVVMSEAVQAVLRQIAAEEVDVLIVEVHLPDGPAWELLPQVRQMNARLPIIAMTDDDSRETSRMMRTQGGQIFYYALKPLDLLEMGQVIDCALRWRRRAAKIN